MLQIYYKYITILFKFKKETNNPGKLHRDFFHRFSMYFPDSRRFFFQKD
jgi:hypothetical protein